jgi:hypothetical protein
MNDTLNTIQQLIKALEAGNYNAAPSQLVQGAALQTEDLSPVMQNVTFEDKHLILQKMLKVESCKSTLAQFDRQLSYGIFGGTANLEGAVGQEETSDFVRIVVPMAYYSHVRRVTVVANMVATVDGKKAEDRASEDAAKKIAADLEFDLFRGKADFSNSGVFDGNPLSVSVLPNMLGLDPQIRQSDSLRSAQDAMFNEYGSDQSVVLAVGGVLQQTNIEDAAVRSAMNMGNADKLLLDPITLASYNKIAFNKERIVLAGASQDSSGAELRKQWTSSGVIDLEASRFLSGKTKPAASRSNGPAAPTLSIASTTVAGVVTAFVAAQVYQYYVTSCNELGESPRSAVTAGTVTLTGDVLDLTITPPGAGTVRYFNVYRSPAGGSTSGATAKFIGRIDRGSAATAVFRDASNKIPGFVTGFLVQGDTMAVKELAPYSRQKLAVTDLTMPEAFYRFACLAVFQPRKNVLLDNLSG